MYVLNAFPDSKVLPRDGSHPPPPRPDHRRAAMSVPGPAVTRRVHRIDALPGYVSHPSFAEPDADRVYAARELLATANDYDSRYMPDDATRDHARRMHYAAHRTHAAASARDRRRWRQTYFEIGRAHV